jgi:hypothetical protein
MPLRGAALSLKSCPHVHRFVQKGREVRPQQNATVLMKGPGGFFDLPFEAVFGGPARNESRNYWIKQEGAEPVIVPEIERFGEKDKVSGQQNWEDVPAGSALEGAVAAHQAGESLPASEGPHSTGHTRTINPFGKRSRTSSALVGGRSRSGECL